MSRISLFASRLSPRGFAARCFARVRALGRGSGTALFACAIGVWLVCAACGSTEPAGAQKSGRGEERVASQGVTLEPSCNIAPGYIGWWKFDEGAGDTTADSSGNGNPGVLGGGNAARKPVWTTGKFGSGLSFDGVDDLVAMGSAALSTSRVPSRSRPGSNQLRTALPVLESFLEEDRAITPTNSRTSTTTARIWRDRVGCSISRLRVTLEIT